MNGLDFKQFYLVIVLAFLALLLNAAIPIYSIHVLELSNNATLEARDNIKILDSLHFNMVNAETGSRGFVITGNSKFLQPYFNSQDRLELLLPELEKSLTTSTNLSTLVKEFKKRILYALERLEKTISIRQIEEPEIAYEMVKSGEGKKRMDAVRSAYNELISIENNRLEELKSKQSKIKFNTNLSIFLLTFVDIVLFGIAFLYLIKSLKISKNMQDNLNILHDESLNNAKLLSQRNHRKNLQAKLNEVLQIVQTQEEAFLAITNYGKHLFSNYSGAFYVKSNSKDYFEKRSQWGTVIQVEGFEPNECWAVRKNNIYNYDGISQDMACNHNMEIQHKHFSICLPTSSADEMIGILVLIDSTIKIGQDISFNEETKSVAEEVVDHIGLAITNLRLRESLKNSSIVDTLTGLYNRRYLNETLGREIARAQRAKQSLGIILLDVDHFKIFNDSYGHEAGDLVLKEVGTLLKHYCRTSDIACRYGGEEFVLVLPDADLSIVIKRAEEIRIAIKSIMLMYGGNTLPAISISAGVSSFPEHSLDINELIKMADDALYQSKRNGRDQTNVYKSD